LYRAMMKNPPKSPFEKGDLKETAIFKGLCKAKGTDFFKL